MLVGYARVSTEDQSLELQIEALKKAGVPEKHIYHEQVSGVKKNRPQFDACLSFLRDGDTLVVWKLDRLGRSLLPLLELLNELNERGVEFHSLTESIDTKTPMGKAMFALMGAFAQLERDMISERTKAGLAVARAKHGHTGGRKPALTDEDCVEAIRLMKETNFSGTKIAGMFRVSRSALYRNVNRYTEQEAAKGNRVADTRQINEER